VEYWWINTDRKKIEILEDKIVPVPLCHQNAHRTTPEWDLALRHERTATNSLSHVAVFEKLKRVYNISKGKAIPLQSWTGVEGSRRLRLPHFNTIGI